MSYCRWSDDSYRCDLYVYEAWDGVTIHVASARYIGDRPAVDVSTPERYFETTRALLAAIGKLPTERIALRDAGETFEGLAYAEAADKIEALRALGYHVPDGVVEELRADAANEATT